MKGLPRLQKLKRRFVPGPRKKMTKTEWKLFAMWAAGDWATWTLGIATDEAEL